MAEIRSAFICTQLCNVLHGGIFIPTGLRAPPCCLPDIPTPGLRFCPRTGKSVEISRIFGFEQNSQLLARYPRIAVPARCYRPGCC